MNMTVYMISVIIYFTMRKVAICRAESYLVEDLREVFRKSPCSHLNFVDIVVGLIPYINAFFAFAFLIMNTDHMSKILDDFRDWCRKNKVEYKE